MARGMLVEYGLSLPPLMFLFDFNPQQVSRSRTLTIKTGQAPGSRGGYDFMSPMETGRVAQGVEMQAESFTLDILLDASERLNAGDVAARTFGVQPQLDTLRAMLEPKTQGPGGLQVLSGIASGAARAFARDETASVLIFSWGIQALPVFLTGFAQKEVMHLSNLAPLRAEVQLTLQVIESVNPFMIGEKVRQTAMVALNAVSTLGGL
ncbi:MAG: hypothetical protein WBA73_02835 [Devosia sp.]